MSMKSEQMLKQRDAKPSKEIDPEHAEQRNTAKHIQRCLTFIFGNWRHKFLIDASVNCSQFNFLVD